MPAYKDKNNTWHCTFWIQGVDGKKKQKTKRGFKTKKGALEYERDYLVTKDGTIDCQFYEFLEIYKNDIKPRVRLNTWVTKSAQIKTHILPYFKEMKMNEIQAKDVVQWQNHLLGLVDCEGKHYSPTYLRTINSQLSAIFNHAVNLYNLRENPVKKAGMIGKKNADEMSIWTRPEFEQFIETQKGDAMAEAGFLILYWCGLRIGELLALTIDDFNFEESTIRINKSYQIINGEDYITEPKTEKSKRTVSVPEKIMYKIELYITSLYDNHGSERVFPRTKHYFNHRLKDGIKALDLPYIRIHDLRHSHASLLADLGYSIVDIAERMGHETINMTFHYAHAMPLRQEEMAKKMNALVEERNE